MMHLYSKVKKNVFFITEIILLFLLVLPYLYTALYSFPTADDYAGAANIRRAAMDSSYLIGSFKLTKNLYFSWQGSYSGEFIDYYFSPILRMGLFGVHAEAVLVVCAFVLLFIMAIWKILRHLQVRFSKEIYFLICEIALFFLLMFMDVDESFYWHTGASMYTIPVLFAFISLILELDILWRYNKWKVVIACLSAFMAAGGTLQISAFICVITLGIALLDYNRNKHINKPIVVVFLVALAGALINVAAPGNYARHTEISEHYYIVESVFDSCKSVFSCVYLKLKNGLLIGTLGLWFVLGINYMKKSEYNYRNPGLVSLYLFCGNIIITFPVKLGYGADYFPSRCIFTQNVFVTISLFVATIYWAGWITNRLQFAFNAGHVLCISLVLILSFQPLLHVDVLQEAVPLKMYDMWGTGAIRQFYEANCAIIKKTEQTDEKEVYIPQEMIPAPIGIIKSLELSTDETDWVNDAVAAYYEKDKIVVY